MHSLQIIQTWPFSPAAMFTAIRHSGSVAWPACRRSPKSMSFDKPSTDYNEPSTYYNKKQQRAFLTFLYPFYTMHEIN